ncbi:hypothetical protein DFP72DRAFT_856717 [Ephemerocybe angulata]|uniref:Ribonuclease H1 N-terminal domain-containing protein n=1 Tax=Ephemerocybe angulata TaxID=980116 RepID=A0A8H6HE24_9AGAR|nr:hypothetical protein DFP72DRAFT_856717 [Tulosesus angulatus]
MVQGSSSSPTTPSSTAPIFSLPDLISALETCGYVIVLPHEQMERDEAVADVSAAQLIESATSAVEATPAPPAPKMENLPSMTILTASAAPTAVPDIHIDNIVAALNTLRVSKSGEGEGVGKGKGKEESCESSGSGSGSGPASGSACGRCQALLPCTRCLGTIPTHPATTSFYCVTVGTQVGIFNDWHIVQPLVSGISGACYKKHKSESEANTAFEAARQLGLVHTVLP